MGNNDMMEGAREMLLIILSIIFAAVTIALLSGHAGFLIAGYNTASAAEKAQYNAKKLSRLVGVGFAPITVVIGLLTVFQDNPPAWLLAALPIVILIGLVFILGFAGRLSRVKPAEGPMTDWEVTSARSKTSRLKVVGLAVVILLGCAGFMLIMLGGNVAVRTEGDTLVVDAFLWNAPKVQADAIQEITYTEDFDRGHRVMGLGNARVQEGNFENEAFGRYKLYAYTQAEAWVILMTTDGILVLSDDNQAGTQAMYTTISTWWQDVTS